LRPSRGREEASRTYREQLRPHSAHSLLPAKKSLFRGKISPFGPKRSLFLPKQVILWQAIEIPIEVLSAFRGFTADGAEIVEEFPLTPPQQATSASQQGTSAPHAAASRRAEPSATSPAAACFRDGEFRSNARLGGRPVS
jgi:hypothetical protein